MQFLSPFFGKMHLCQEERGCERECENNFFQLRLYEKRALPTSKRNKNMRECFGARAGGVPLAKTEAPNASLTVDFSCFGRWVDVCHFRSSSRSRLTTNVGREINRRSGSKRGAHVVFHIALHGEHQFASDFVLLAHFRSAQLIARECAAPQRSALCVYSAQIGATNFSVFLSIESRRKKREERTKCKFSHFYCCK